MTYEETICYDLAEIHKEIEHAVKNKSLNLPKVLAHLKRAKKSAQRMENALLLRKKVMQEQSIEDSYKQAKNAENTPTGINDIQSQEKKTEPSTVFKVTVEQDGKVIYEQETKGLIASCVENIEDIDNDGVLHGKAQTFMGGHPLTIFFAFDQLEQAYRDKRVAITAAMQEMMLNNTALNPVVKKQLLDIFNLKQKNRP